MKIQSTLDLQETIVALSSAPGPGARAVIRLTGGTAWGCLTSCLHTKVGLPERLQRSRWEGALHWPEIRAGVPAVVYAWAAPRSYTGQDLVEVHTLSSPPLIEGLLAHLLRNGARAALPGEFTLRAFLAGKLDLTQAEAILGVIEARDTDELRTALTQLAGGLGRPLHQLRDQLLGVLAEVEAGLDFADEDLTFISRAELLDHLRSMRATLEELRSQVEGRALSGRPVRIVLCGRPNAGKSSLFNALAYRSLALVSPEPGTTRDYLVQRCTFAGVEVELIDTAGHEEIASPARDHPYPGHGITQQAQDARQEQMTQADLLLVCLDATQRPSEEELAILADAKRAQGVWTKGDLLQRREGLALDLPQTSVTTGEGIPALRALLGQRIRAHQRPAALAPSLSRCRHHLDATVDHLSHAEALVNQHEPPELLALELRLVLDQMGEMVGAVYTDDLLDRIFSQFCIGK